MEFLDEGMGVRRSGEKRVFRDLISSNGLLFELEDQDTSFRSGFSIFATISIDLEERLPRFSSPLTSWLRALLVLSSLSHNCE